MLIVLGIVYFFAVAVILLFMAGATRLGKRLDDSNPVCSRSDDDRENAA